MNFEGANAMGVRTALDYLDAAWITLDKHHCVVAGSSAASALLGVSVEYQQALETLFGEQSGIALRVAFHDISAGRASSVGLDVTVINGAVHLAVGVLAIPIRDTRAELIGFMLTLRDGDDTQSPKKLLRDLEIRQRLLDAIIDQLPAGIVARDAKTTETLIANALFDQIVGVSRATPIREGLSVYEARRLDGTRYALEELPIMRAMTSGEVVANEEICLKKADGSFGIFSCNAVPIRDGTGEIIAGAVTLVDVTEARERERERAILLGAERMARADAEASNRAKDEFLAIASHELRTPLNAILGWTQLLRSGRLDQAAMLRALDTIERNGRAQDKLIEDILDGARIASGKLHLAVREFDMNALVRSAIEAVQPSAIAKGIALTMSVDPEPLPICGDPERVQQVIWNLANNALKFTPGGGNVSVTCQRVEDQVELIVRDDGEGIDVAFLPHVFDEFRQAEGSATRRHGGLGLGLALVRHFVAAHGGTVRAHSLGLGRGAAFHVLIPHRLSESERSAGAPVSSRRLPLVASGSFLPLRGVTVLVIDDDVDSCELTAAILRTYGASVNTASSSEDGLREMLSWPTVIVSSLAIANQSAGGLLAHIRKSPLGAGVPMVALIAHAREGERARARAAGFRACVAKPVEPEQLVRVVAKVVSALPRATT